MFVVFFSPHCRLRAKGVFNCWVLIFCFSQFSPLRIQELTERFLFPPLLCTVTNRTKEAYAVDCGIEYAFVTRKVSF